MSITNKVGLVNRTDHSIVVKFKDGNSMMLFPKQKTSREFIKDNIVSVNGKSLKNATMEVLVF